jgi:hypothetical protein
VTHGLSGPSRRSWRSGPCQNATVGAFPVMIGHTVRSTCATTNCSRRLPPFLLSTRRGQEATNCQSCPPFRPFSAERHTLLSLRPVYGQCRRSSRLDVLTVRFACKCHAPMGGSLAVVAARSPQPAAAEIPAWHSTRPISRRSLEYLAVCISGQNFPHVSSAPKSRRRF